MKNRRPEAWIFPLLILGTGALVLLAGCHPANHAMPARTDVSCTACLAQMRVMPVTGMSYTAHSCPSCRRVSVLDDATHAAVERAVGGQAGDTVHTCDLCSTVSDCPLCRREMS
jgi:hypothetical protein